MTFSFPAMLAVFLGAGLGGVLRHVLNFAIPRVSGLNFPFATFFINVTGSFVMGLLATWFLTRMGEGQSQHLRLFLTTGVLGGYTTFSTFSLDFAFLVERGDVPLAFAYVAGSVVLSLIAVFAGMMLVRAFV